jgi:zinc transport system substrate-binding protein
MKGLKYKLVFRLTLLALLILSGCVQQTVRQEEGENGKDKPLIYTSIYPIYDFANNVGKDKISLKMMIPPGSEPHDWEPTAKMMTELEKADVFIYNGAGMEPWAEKMIGAVNNKKLIVVEASNGIDLLKSGQCEHEGEEYDPHVWLDPNNAIKQTENIKNALIQVDPDNKEFYELNCREYVDKLLDLDREIEQVVEKLKYKELVVTHAAFGYFTNRYGLKQIAVKGLTPQEEPSAAKLTEIAKLLKEKELKYVYLETLSDPRLSEVLAREVGAKTALLNPIGGVTSEDIKQGKDYLFIMKENLNTLRQTLGE